MLYVARFIAGISVGLLYSNVIPIYLSEIASAKIRGIITILSSVFIKVGVLYVYSVGPFVTIAQMAWMNLIPLALFILLFVWMPESPYFLLSTKNFESAHKSLAKLRGHKDVNEELQLISAAIKPSAENSSSMKMLFNRSNIRSFIIIFVLQLAQHFCGCIPVMAYSEIIFSQIENSLLTASESNIILGVIMLVSAIVCSFIIDRFGRRPLLLYSALALAISNISLATYFELKQQQINITNLAWLPTTALMVMVTGFGLGFSTVIFVLMGEIFPKQIKSGANAIIGVCAVAVGIGVLKGFQFYSDNYGYNVSFWVFSFCSVLVVPFVWFMVPETKGKSLALILEELNSTNKLRKL